MGVNLVSRREVRSKIPKPLSYRTAVDDLRLPAAVLSRSNKRRRGTCSVVRHAPQIGVNQNHRSTNHQAIKRAGPSRPRRPPRTAPIETPAQTWGFIPHPPAGSPPPGGFCRPAKVYSRRRPTIARADQPSALRRQRHGDQANRNDSEPSARHCFTWGTPSRNGGSFRRTELWPKLVGRSPSVC
jgi:hypothetical protein